MQPHTVFTVAPKPVDGSPSESDRAHAVFEPRSDPASFSRSDGAHSRSRRSLIVEVQLVEKPLGDPPVDERE
ncbi:hypothetical protein EA472_20560 [Natrarchaeobius oligotrophus]|uniref:Uncharacterized protein n=1 Tax=Natrarchaeobius chitinivorans TaxID=1679083 RepID=A0A3N6PAU0_NATCH|nr:hypothetical protein EA472_20560 [Natrarchaeobius chitinivorans]